LRSVQCFDVGWREIGNRRCGQCCNGGGRNFAKLGGCQRSNLGGGESTELRAGSAKETGTPSRSGSRSACRPGPQSEWSLVLPTGRRSASAAAFEPILRPDLTSEPRSEWSTGQ